MQEENQILDEIQKHYRDLEQLLLELQSLETRIDIVEHESHESRLSNTLNTMLQHIYKYPELFAFYSQAYRLLNSLYQACASLSTGYVSKKDTTTTTVLKVAGDGVEAVSAVAGVGIDVVAPGVGTAIRYVGMGAGKLLKVGAFIHEARELNKLKRFADLFTSQHEFEQVSQRVAIMLTLRYEDQIKQLTTRTRVAEKKGIINKIKKWFNKIDLAQDYVNGGAEELAESAVGKMFDALRTGVITVDNTNPEIMMESLVRQLVAVV